MEKKVILIISVMVLILSIILFFVTSNNSLDKFGITKLYEDAPYGREWISKWDNGYERTWTDSTDDLYDPEFLTREKGIGTYKTVGNGILKISGSTPRMYIVDMTQTRGWRNVEITVYGRRISDDNTTWGGIMAYARTNHLIDSDYCDTRGYGGRFRYDGDLDFEKETKHDSVFDSVVAKKTYWPVSMTKNIWIGYKYVVYDMPDGNVRLELWIDETDGINGGNWTKVNEFIDNGSNFGVGGTPCKSGIDPALRLTASDSRPGSEKGKPNFVVYFRSDDVGTDGLLYKKASVREIVPIRQTSTPPPSPTPSPTPTSPTKTIMFRDDDAQPWYNFKTFENITNTLIKNNISQTIGVIPYANGISIGSDTTIKNYLNTIKNFNSVELALHGYRHTSKEFGNLNQSTAEANVSSGLAIFKSDLNMVPVTFIPPNHAYNSATINAIKNQGLTRFSTGLNNDNYPWHENPAGLLHVPSVSDFHDWDKNRPRTYDQITSDCQRSLDQYDACVILFHFSTFKGNGSVAVDPVLYQTLLDVINWTHKKESEGAKLMTIEQYGWEKR